MGAADTSDRKLSSLPKLARDARHAAVTCRSHCNGSRTPYAYVWRPWWLFIKVRFEISNRMQDLPVSSAGLELQGLRFLPQEALS